eukprot:m.382616 g.382616  ORF g.382616 m.382616 type:complete len:187 (-) comp20974_c0_seq6:1688-2248(-)
MVSLVVRCTQVLRSVGIRHVLPKFDLQYHRACRSRSVQAAVTQRDGVSRLRISFGIHGVGKSAATRRMSPHGTQTELTKKCVHQFGEDAAFVCGPVMGVADGVGGWKKYDVDPAIFPRILLEHCFNLISHGGPSSRTDDDSEPLLLQVVHGLICQARVRPFAFNLYVNVQRMLLHGIGRTFINIAG